MRLHSYQSPNNRNTLGESLACLNIWTQFHGSIHWKVEDSRRALEDTPTEVFDKNVLEQHVQVQFMTSTFIRRRQTFKTTTPTKQEAAKTENHQNSRNKASWRPPSKPD